MLEQERDFFDADTKDKLKVPPYTKVKRIPRDYTNEEQIVLKYKHQRELEEKDKAKREYEIEGSPPVRTSAAAGNISEEDQGGVPGRAHLPKNLPWASQLHTQNVLPFFQISNF